jgi:hypothetical protein
MTWKIKSKIIKSKKIKNVKKKKGVPINTKAFGNKPQIF